MKRCVPLECAAEKVCDASAIPPLIFQLPPEQGREKLEEAQNTPVYLYPAAVSVRNWDTGKFGTIPVYSVMPKTERPIKNIIFYIHGAGWVFGSFHTHEKLVRELAVRTNSCVIFPEYSRSPEAKYPVAIEQCFHLLSHLREPGFLPFHNNTEAEIPLIIAGDSVGGNMAIAMCLMSQKRSCPAAGKLLLYYPVTDACFDTPSYCQFAVDYYLYRDGMKWFWEQYTACSEDRNQITASPLRASLTDLQPFPDTLIVNGQADVLRSEGEAFGEKLRLAGVNVTAVQIQGIIHDFIMLNSLDSTNACRLAMDISTDWINNSII